MKKKGLKKKVFVTAALVAVLAIIAGGTNAYFSQDARARNVITMGSISIELHEDKIDPETGDTVPYETETPVEVMPGVEVSKIVTVENTGSAPAWIRIKVTKRIELAEGQTPGEGEPDTDLIALDIGSSWTEQDGWYYYNEALEAGETTDPLFNTAAFAGDMSNLYQESTAYIDVLVQAVQTSGNGSSALEATGWPAETVTEAENNG